MRHVDKQKNEIISSNEEATETKMKSIGGEHPYTGSHSEESLATYE